MITQYAAKTVKIAIKKDMINAIFLLFLSKFFKRDPFILEKIGKNPVAKLPIIIAAELAKTNETL